MVVYNRGREKIEHKTGKPKEIEHARKPEPIIEDIDLLDSCETLIGQIQRQRISDKTNNGLYHTLLQNLRRAYDEGAIDLEQFNHYKGLADQSIDKEASKQQKKTFFDGGSAKKESKKKTVEEKEEESSSGYGSSEKADEAMRVRGEKNLDEETLKAKKEENLGKKIGKFKAFVEFMQTPIARVLFFIIVGVFLLIYLTKSNMSDVLGSPMIIVLVVVFMFLILGKGGKTRRHDYSDSQLGY